MVFEVCHVSTRYGQKEVLSDISFSFEEGEVVSVLGPNGVGKSTLFKSILQLKKYKGTFLLNGKALSGMSHKELAKHIAYVPQFCDIPFPYKVKEVMVTGRFARSRGQGAPKVEDFKRVNQVMKELGISELKNKKINQLSGGEKQMVMIGRALLQEPEILLMDEPSASLDFGNTHRVIRKIKELSEEGMAIMLTTHSPQMASMCGDRILMLKNKEVYQYGKKEQVMGSEHLIHLYDLESEEALELCHCL